jgi:peptidoglycan-associated lipoprotein
MLKSLQRLFALTVLGSFLVACESTMETKDGNAEGASISTSSPSTSTDSASTIGVGSGSTFQGHPLDNPDSQLYRRTVYFAYDSSTVLEEDRPIVEAHARYLAANPNAAATLEGHADERGSREYNIGLGERRASSVRQLMSLLGSSGSQIRMVSYGEERPAVEGHDEASWNQNRRVEIIYRNR